MRQVVRIVTVAALLAFGSSAAHAQGVGFSLYGFGGGYGAMNDLTAASVSTVNFKAGWNVGAGLGLSFTRFLGVRGDVALAKSQRAGSGTNTDWQKIFTGADLVLTLPLGPLSPYAFGGGGVVTLDEEDTTTPLSSRRAGRAGLGVNVGSGKLGVFGQATGWFYKWDVTKFPTFTEQQFDMLYSLGVSYKMR